LRDPFVDPAIVYQSRSWLDDQALAPAHRGDITSCLLRRVACACQGRQVHRSKKDVLGLSGEERFLLH
jgi:phage-related tail fiber protein